MKTVRFIAGILYYLSRLGALLFLITVFYALLILLINYFYPSASIPLQVDEASRFIIYFPLTKTPFLLGEYTTAFLFINFFTIAFYGLFLWLLSSVFHTFRQPRLFTQKGMMRLSRFYSINLMLPVIFLVLLLIFSQEAGDIIRIMFLHLVIGVFAFFMAAIFKQGLELQQEQDLTF